MNEIIKILVNLITGLEALGAEIFVDECGIIHALAPNGLTGCVHILARPTVTGTANLIMAATLAKGRTILHGVAKEPEIGDLVTCLQNMGAQISGKGTSTIVIEGSSILS